MADNIYWHHNSINRKDRELLNNHKSFILWFTGMSASGKSTLAVLTDKVLYKLGCRTYILDGDNIRHGVNKDLNFSVEDRAENIRRVIEIAKLFCDSGIISLAAFISPYIKERLAARKICGKGDFVEIFVDCPIEICEQRDPKGIYKKVRKGAIKGFTGIDAPYEKPVNPEIHLRTDTVSIKESIELIIKYLVEHKYIMPNNSYQRIISNEIT
jgi:adenylylsulfate kinase